jgi:hypothetical protein
MGEKWGEGRFATPAYKLVLRGSRFRGDKTHPLLTVLLVRDELPDPLPGTLDLSASRDTLRLLQSLASSTLRFFAACAFSFLALFDLAWSAMMSLNLSEWLKISFSLPSGLTAVCHAAFLNNERFFGGAAGSFVGGSAMIAKACTV